METDIIKSYLANCEKDNEIRIFLAVEAGSRSWGMANEDSDYDVKFIYVHQPEWYLFIDEGRRDVIDYKAVTPQNIAVDLNGWDIKKALKMLRESNCGIMEWLFSPIVYAADETFLKDCRALALSMVSWKSVAFHFLNQAKKHLRDYFEGHTNVITKKYFYVLRPLLCCEWLRQKQIAEMPPSLLTDLLASISLPEEVLFTIQSLIKKKIETKMSTSLKEERIKILDDWISQTSVACEEYAASQLKVKKLPDTQPFNQLITKTVFK